MTRPRLLPLLAAALLVVLSIAVLVRQPDRRSAGFFGAPASDRALRLSRSLASTSASIATSASASAAADKAASTREAVARAEQAGPDHDPDTLEARKLIRTGTLAIEVEAYAEAADRAVGIVSARGGFVADSRAVREAGDRRRGTLVLRIDASQFDAAFRELKALGRAESATVETQDVTRAYADLETRLAVKRAAQARLTEILRDRTGRLSDLIEAERELTRLVEESEQLEGERRYMARQAELATITVELYEPAAFLRDGAFAPLSQAFQEALPLLAKSAAGLLYLAAAGLPWAIVALAVWKLRKRARVRRVIRYAAAEE